jgi:hypothetical protein
MVGALQRPGDGDQRPRPGHAARQCLDVGRWHAANGGSPRGILRLTIRLAEQIGREMLPTRAVPRQKSQIVPVLRYQCMGKP